MKIAVITPCYNPDSTLLAQCISSVQAQTHQNVLHILVNDGGDKLAIDSHPKLESIHLSHNFADYGDSPRAIGALYGFARGAGAVCFLDVDNWYLPHHVQSLVEYQQALKVPFISSLRLLASLDGDIMGPCIESDGFHFCDTNTMFFTREIASLATSWWSILPELHTIGDRIIWDNILSSDIRFACTDKATVVYRTRFAHHYKLHNKSIPASAIDGEYISQFKERIEELQQRAKFFANKNFVQR